jgi:predicted amidophosphoribosyltransferase
MSNCTKCGQPLEEGANFCRECGAAVRRCPRCGEVVKEDAAYCKQCGAAVNQVAPDDGAGASPPPPISYPVAAQAPATSGYVRLTLGEIALFFGQITITILIDGNAVRTIQMNETVDLVVPVGRHTIELVQVYHSAATLNMPITRKSDLELNVVAGTLTVVTGTYSTFFGKFSMDLG